MNKNPLANCDRVLGREHLIGRSDILQRINDKAKQGGNICLYGLVRVGKSSIFQTSLIENKQNLHKERIVPVLYDDLSFEITRDYKQEQFFQLLLQRCLEELQESDLASTKICQLADEAIGEDTHFNFNAIAKFFRQIHKDGIRVILILEKFDHVADIFQDSSFYDKLINILDKSTGSVQFFIESLRPLNEILPPSHYNSQFDTKFFTYCLGLFDDHDTQLYYDLLSSVTSRSQSLPVTSTLREMLDAYCGSHPYLLIKFGEEVIRSFIYHNSIDMIHIAQELEYLCERYETDLLRDEIRQEKLQQILFGPIHGLEQKDVQSMLKYGLIRPNPAWSSEQTSETAAYIAFSSHFQHHLQNRLSNAEYHWLLKQSEQNLHTIIVRVLEHDDERLNSLASARSTFEHLFALIFNQWEIFKPLLAKDKRKGEHYWHECARVLIWMSKPLLQERVDATMQVAYRETSGYCEEIKDILELLEKQIQAVEQEKISQWIETVKPGNILWHRYEIQGTLGQTGNRRVVKVWDMHNKSFCAAKVLYSGYELSEEQAKQLGEALKREADILRRLRHDHIGGVHTAMISPYGIVMDLVEGYSLREFWDEGNQLTPEQVIELGIKLADALKYAHSKHVIHRDIKPENIIIKNDKQPVLIDFDIASMPDVQTILNGDTGNVNSLIGSPGYFVPECYHQPIQLGPASDIFTLGLVLYKALMPDHRSPYPSSTDPAFYDHSRLPVPTQNSIPEPLYHLLCAMLHQDPAQRPSAEKVYHALQSNLGSSNHYVEVAQKPQDVPVIIRVKVEAFQQFAAKHGWSFTGKFIHNAIYQLRLGSENSIVPVNFYPTGTVLIQGKASAMRSSLEQWWTIKQNAENPPVF